MWCGAVSSWTSEVEIEFGHVTTYGIHFATNTAKLQDQPTLIVHMKAIMDTDDDLPMNKYFEGYFDAHQLYHSGLFEECIGAAKYNITDPVMPRYHQMKNLILIVAALDGWEEADRYLEKAETIYEEANRLAGKTDEKAQTSLRQVRKDMDELIQGMNEDWEAEIHSHDEEAEVETGEEQDSSEVPRAAKQAEAQVYCPRVSANTEIRPTQIEGDEKRAKGALQEQLSLRSPTCRSKSRSCAKPWLHRYVGRRTHTKSRPPS